jgi:hypothetical protein
MENKYYKINQEGGSYIVATFYNPVTKKSKTECVRDYDYGDCSRDNDELYYMEINEEVRKIYLHDHGVILEGDYARVVKGRTIEHGFVGKVVAKKEYKDRYGRWIADYIYFDDGRKINIKNCELA